MSGALAFDSLTGPVLPVLEGHVARDQIPAIKDELIVMVTAHLKAADAIR